MILTLITSPDVMSLIILSSKSLCHLAIRRRRYGVNPKNRETPPRRRIRTVPYIQPRGTKLSLFARNQPALHLARKDGELVALKREALVVPK
jgi:hypothetical protein